MSGWMAIDCLQDAIIDRHRPARPRQSGGFPSGWAAEAVRRYFGSPFGPSVPHRF
jgi:hypothetical protein